MANRRMIAGDIFEDDFIGSLDYFQRLLWIGSITSVADDQGRMMDNPALIRSKVFLYDAAVLDSEVETALRKINIARKIARYVSGGKALIQIVNWWKYQTPAWSSPSKFLAPAGWMDRVKYHSVGNKIITINWDKIGGYVAGYIDEQHSPIEDGEVKGDGKGDGDGEGEGAGKPPASAAFIPQTVEEKIYCAVTNHPTIPSGEVDSVLDRIAKIKAAKSLDTDGMLAYLRPFWFAQKERYPGSTRAFWLDWAVIGEIPKPGGNGKNGKKTTHDVLSEILQEQLRAEANGNTTPSH